MFKFIYYDGSVLTGYEFEIIDNVYFIDGYRHVPMADIERVVITGEEV